MDDLVARDRRGAVARECAQRLALARPDAAGDRDGDRTAAHSSVLDASGSAAGAVVRLGGSVGSARPRRAQLLSAAASAGASSARRPPRSSARRPERSADGSSASGAACSAKTSSDEVEIRPRVHRLAAVGARLHRIGVLDALQRQREAPALPVDLDDLHVDRPGPARRPRAGSRRDAARARRCARAPRRPGGSRRRRRT